MKRPAILFYAAIAVAAVIADQWIKGLVVDGMELYETIEILPFLALHHTRNTGIAFSLFAGLDDTFMLFVTIAVIGFVLWLMARSGDRQQFARIGFALVIGGAIGNVIDRALLGYVVDYVLFHTRSWSFAVFNLADALITVGAGLIILQEIVDWKRDRGNPESREPPPGG